VIKTEAVKTLLNIAAVSLVVAMAVYGTVSFIAAEDPSTNNTVDLFSTNTIYVPDDYERIQWAVDNVTEKPLWWEIE